MSTAVYPGSFNPWHKGHEDVLQKALMVFDRVIIAQGVNQGKPLSERERLPVSIKARWGGRVNFASYHGLLRDFLDGKKVDAVVKGLRNAQDLEYETCQQYWNEDLGLKIPVFYVVCDRSLRHVSSSAIRAVGKIKEGSLV